jgi:hypothetical protein
MNGMKAWILISAHNLTDDEHAVRVNSRIGDLHLDKSDLSHARCIILQASLSAQHASSRIDLWFSRRRLSKVVEGRCECKRRERVIDVRKVK